MYCATKLGIERRMYVIKDRRLKRRLKRMKRALTERVPMWRVLSVEILAFARSFFAFCAIVVETVRRYRLEEL